MKSRFAGLFFPMFLFAAAVAISCYSAWRAVAETRLRAQVKTCLLEVQRALQDYHVAEENYPRKTPLTGADLIGLLLEAGHLKAPPRNPWTGEAYRPDGETAASDRLRYGTDELAETYSLTALAPGNESVFLQLDSTEHPALEED